MATLESVLPTLYPAVGGAYRALRRFPLVLLAAVVTAVVAILQADRLADEEALLRIGASAVLGIPLFLALGLFGERAIRGIAGRVIVAVLGLGVLVGVYLAWPGWSDDVRALRFLQLGVAFHLLVAFLPYVGRAERRGFWQYNLTLLERAIVSALYTVVLYGGAAIALVAMDKLFGVDVPGTGYLRLWVVLGFVFNTWFFLGGVPRDFDALETPRDYPVGIKAFTQYALLPIVAVYLVILTVYLGKVVVTWNWPSGWIGYLVSSVAAVGIFSLLLVHPVASDAGNRWVMAYARGFWIALLPAIVMLWLAIWQRVRQYGVTEPRYFLSVLSLWLAAMAVYALVTRFRSIRVIPASLCLGALVTFFGPWGAYRVSERSQVHRLEQILRRNDLLAAGRVRPATVEVPFEDRKEISATLRYLLGTHGTRAIAPWFQDVLAASDTLASGERPSRRLDERVRRLVAHLNVPYVGRGESGAPRYYRYTADLRGTTVPVTGYDVLLWVSDRREGAGPLAEFRTVHGRQGRALDVMRGAELLTSLPLDTLVMGLRANAGDGARQREVPADSLRLERESPLAHVVLYVEAITGEAGRDSLAVRGVSGVVLVKLK